MNVKGLSCSGRRTGCICGSKKWAQVGYERARWGCRISEQLLLRVVHLVWRMVSRIQCSVPSIYAERGGGGVLQMQPSRRNVSSSRNDIFLHSALSRGASLSLDFTARPFLPVRPAALSGLAHQLRQLVASVEFTMN